MGKGNGHMVGAEDTVVLHGAIIRTLSYIRYCTAAVCGRIFDLFYIGTASTLYYCDRRAKIMMTKLLKKNENTLQL